MKSSTRRISVWRRQRHTSHAYITVIFRPYFMQFNSKKFNSVFILLFSSLCSFSIRPFYKMHFFLGEISIHSIEKVNFHVELWAINQNEVPFSLLSNFHIHTMFEWSRKKKWLKLKHIFAHGEFTNWQLS